MTKKTEVLDGSELERIHDLMAEVVCKSSKREDTCVYRGEPERYPLVSSGLFRECPDSAHEAFDISRVEQEMAETAREYTTLADDDEILTDIQHFGGTTNLIDFTDDYLIALFFASVESERTDGRVVLHWPEPDSVVRPKPTMNRIVSQKSVFVRPRRGFIVPDADEETVVVPADLKSSILTFLERFHGISEKTVYNDIHGFIRHQASSRSRYARAFRASLPRPRHDQMRFWTHWLEARGITTSLEEMRHAYHQRGMVYKDGRGSTFLLDGCPTPQRGSTWVCELNAEEVVELFTHLIENKQAATRLGEPYCRRGEAHLYRGAVDLAIRDFDEALDRDAKMPEAYHGRGNAYKQQGDADRARADLDKALRLKPGLVAALIDRGNRHRQSGSLGDAIRDFDAAIGIMRRGADGRLIRVGDGHFARAVARCARRDWVEAKGDLEAARQEGVLVVASFRAICGGIPGFEAQYDLRMPSVVATMLHVARSATQRGRSAPP